MLEDSDPRKWTYEPRTAAKHAALTEYLKAWLPILGRAARARGLPAHLVLVDGFAGKGRYVDGEPGSPLILRDLAAMAIGTGTVDEIELFFVEKDPTNHANLCSALTETGSVSGLALRTPILQPFADAAPGILGDLTRRPRPSFWFVDPFGFGGVPLQTVQAILSRPRSEVFVTFMARDVNRFLESGNHRVAIAELLGLGSETLDQATALILGSERRVQALRDLYQRRLTNTGAAQYVWTFRIASSGADDTVYYLVHASNHIKAFREMKDATHRVGGWRSAFLGTDDFAVTGQLELPEFATDHATLRQQILSIFAGREFAYDPPLDSSKANFLNEVYPDPRFHMWVEKDFRAALVDLIRDGRIRKVPIDTRGARGIRGRDRIQIPEARQLRF